MSDTPMMRQYKNLKQKAKDAILFFRLGDFYEMFQEDAKEVSSLLNLTLTKRNNVPMCGIPYHASKSYIARLLKLGKKIAVCEQINLPLNGRGIAERDIIEIITPGTVLEQDFLEREKNNYLLALGKVKNRISLAFIDSSTGEFHATSYITAERIPKVREELARIQPRELLIQESLLEEDPALQQIINEKHKLVINRFPDWHFDQENSVELLKTQFHVLNLKGFGIDDNDPALFATGVLLEYLQENAHRTLPQIRTLHVYDDDEYVGLDESSQRNLELIGNMYDGSKRYTLLEVLDETKTAAGSRKLKNWIVHPLRKKTKMTERQEKVEFLYRDQMLLSSLRDILGSLLDIERLTTRIATEKAHAKDLLAIKTSIEGALKIEAVLEDLRAEKLFWSEDERLKTAMTLVQSLIEKAITDEPSILFNEGNIIKENYSKELDDLKELKTNSKKVLDNYLKREKEDTGISSLKIKYNKILGYFLEVTKSNARLVPDHFIRRQSLVGTERYTTETLVELESELNNASEKIIELEKTLFLEVRQHIEEHSKELFSVADLLSNLDCYCSLAYTATVHGYVKPQLNESGNVDIVEGRHPVVEYNLPTGEYIPNSLTLDSTAVSFALITGPNMAGKSTFLRQTALIVLMAQIGSFVPAQSAAIGIVDKVFCRVGATDNLARGESTFLVEMNEAAYILRTATTRSLIIMDEIGRGTSTNDGFSLAWSITEYLLNKIGAKTLFATHFHDLTAMKHEKLTNLYLDILEEGNEIVFLKKVQPGVANNSYGIHVAKLAGVPDEVVLRAGNILKAIGGYNEKWTVGKTITNQDKRMSPPQQELFSENQLVIDTIKNLNIENLTPIDALTTLYSLQQKIKK